MPLRSVSVVIACFVALLATPLVCSAEDHAVLLRLGTSGFALEASTALSPTLGLRAGGSLFTLSVTRRESDLTYDADLKLRSLAGYVDLYPGDGAFRFTAGLVFNKNRIEAVGVPTGGTFELNGQRYDASDVGTLTGTGRIGSRTWAPYLGLGVGSSRGPSRVFFALDLGVIFHGSPTVSLGATGPLASDLGFRADLAAEERDANDDIEGYRYYPVLSIGLGIRF